jgi:type IV secretory pathway VirJ component
MHGRIVGSFVALAVVLSECAGCTHGATVEQSSATAVAATEVAGGIADLPLTEVPAQREGTWLAVIVTGDGGWAKLDQSVAEALATRGIGVVGLNSLRYLWKGKTPERIGSDLERILRFYMQRWDRRRLIVVGYSIGADVLPFMVSRVSPEVREAIEVVALIGPGRTAQFEIHIAGWLGLSGAGVPVMPELEKLAGMRILCVHGNREGSSLCSTLPEGLAENVTLPGGHHFGGDYAAVAGAVIEAMAD